MMSRHGLVRYGFELKVEGRALGVGEGGIGMQSVVDNFVFLILVALASDAHHD